MNVGWLGLGAMGAPMAVVTAGAGHRVVGFDVDAARAEALAGDGVEPAGSPAEAAAEADVLVVIVATPDQAEQALFGPSGAAAGLRSGSVVLVMATVGVGPVVEWEARLADAGVRVVDAPVSGGVKRAATGDLLVMVGGAAADVARVEPLLVAMSAAHPHVGANVGDGQRVKLVNQLLCGVHIAVAAEALAFAESLGLDPRACWEVLRGGAAASFMLDDRGDRMTGPPHTDVNSALDIFVKDMGLVRAAAEASGAWTPLAEVAERLYADGSRAGLGRADDASVIRVLRNGGR